VIVVSCKGVLVTTVVCSREFVVVSSTATVELLLRGRVVKIIV